MKQLLAMFIKRPELVISNVEISTKPIDLDLDFEISNHGKAAARIIDVSIKVFDHNNKEMEVDYNITPDVNNLIHRGDTLRYKIHINMQEGSSLETTESFNRINKIDLICSYDYNIPIKLNLFKYSHVMTTSINYDSARVISFSSRSSIVKYFVYISLILFVLAWLYLLLTDTRLLLKEVKVEPGQEYVVPEHGDLGKNKQSILVCKYFNGRKILHRVYWYSSNNFMGKDSCPFLLRD